jgi:hypothetical protein
MNQKSSGPRAMIRQSGSRVFGPQVQGPWTLDKVSRSRDRGVFLRYWEAVLVLKLKPSQQSNISKYIGLVKKINNNEFVKTPVENKEKSFKKVLDNNKLEMKIIAYRHLMEFKKYMEAVN